MPTITSNTSHSIRCPAIYISFISKPPPLGLSMWPAWLTISLAIPSAILLGPVHIFLVANWIQHPLRMHLPGPNIPMTNSFSVIGSCVVYLSSVLQAWNALSAAGKYSHWTILDFTCRILLIGVINFIVFKYKIGYRNKVETTSFTMTIQKLTLIRLTILWLY